ncbi:MAG: GntR family transcriptional regulator [Paracoccaceae bacterium]
MLPRTVQEETVEKLRLAIVSGHFQPGARLVESQLCVELGISRPSLREALRSLAAERLINLVPNRGPSIPELTWEEVTAIYEVREMLEVDAVGRCSQRITKDELEKLENALSAFETATLNNDSVARITTTEDFYSIILAVRKPDSGRDSPWPRRPHQPVPLAFHVARRARDQQSRGDEGHLQSHRRPR